ncbi:TPA: phage protein NinX family protein [Enterobacter asburiae]
MDYSKLSDFEINCLVAEATGHKPFNAELGYQGLQEPGDITAAIVRGPRCIGGFDPCKNPEQAWPLILKNRISLVWDCAEDASSEWWNAVDQLDECRVQYQSNPLRGAMIVFLMLREQANVQDNPA